MYTLSSSINSFFRSLKLL
uniref:Uncharacterized protein n=1 Tax=Arundo donax TaxID=35708 RepID=A0A0A8XV33_ARUDO